MKFHFKNIAQAFDGSDFKKPRIFVGYANSGRMVASFIGAAHAEIHHFDNDEGCEVFMTDEHLIVRDFLIPADQEYAETFRRFQLASCSSKQDTPELEVRELLRFTPGRVHLQYPINTHFPSLPDLGYGPYFARTIQQAIDLKAEFQDTGFNLFIQLFSPALANTLPEDEVVKELVTSLIERKLYDQVELYHCKNTHDGIDVRRLN